MVDNNSLFFYQKMKINGIKEKIGANSAEEIVSMILGLMVVVVVIGLVVNFVQKRRGSIDIPGINTFENLSLADSEEDKNIEESTADSADYVVAMGDSLWKIAETKLGSGYLWKDIASLNNITNPGYIEVGQTLALPEEKESEVVSAQLTSPSVKEGEDYTVVKGDHLWKLAVSAYGDGFRWVDIWQANESTIANPSEIEIGMTLKIPKIESNSVVE